VNFNPAIVFPHRKGSQGPHDTVWVTATRFQFTSTAAAIAAAPRALRFWARWPQVPGSTRLWIRYEPLTRCSWTLSTWTERDGIQAFLRSPGHLAVMRDFRDRINGSSHSWQTEAFDPAEGWAEARRALAPG
jgi:hypothetical protein